LQAGHNNVYNKINKFFPFEYGMKILPDGSTEATYALKLRGCWERRDSTLDFEQFREMVNSYGMPDAPDPVVLERTHFRPDWRRGQITTRTQQRFIFPPFCCPFLHIENSEVMRRSSTRALLTENSTFIPMAIEAHPFKHPFFILTSLQHKFICYNF
jgi:hypothetical protein